MGIDLLLWLADAMHGILFDDAELDGVRENATEESNRSGCGASSAAHDSPPAQLIGLDVRAGLARHDVLHGLGDVGFGQIPHPPIAEQRNNVALDAPHVVEIVVAFFGQLRLPSTNPFLRSSR
jgi:hypothetical protein